MVDISSENANRRNLYANLMKELKLRVDLVDGILDGKFGLPGMAAFELAYLQFRLIAELVALASLAAHGDVPATTSGRLTKAYQADVILNSLEKLHPKFYPVPGRQFRDGMGRLNVEKVSTGFLTKADLIKLYHETGDLLHRGTLRGIKDRTVGDWAKIRATKDKIIALLSHHQIQLIDPKYQLWVVMKAADGEVHVHLMEAMA